MVAVLDHGKKHTELTLLDLCVFQCHGIKRVRRVNPTDSGKAATIGQIGVFFGAPDSAQYMVQRNVYNIVHNIVSNIVNMGELLSVSARRYQVVCRRYVEEERKRVPLPTMKHTFEQRRDNSTSAFQRVIDCSA